MTDAPNPAVLIVEDEVLVRMMTADALAPRRFDVLEAGAADEALETLGSRPDVGLMIVDIAMPGEIDGLELARTVATRYPDLPILITSGRQELQGADLPPNTRFLPKPFSATGLNWAVDEALGTRCSPSAA